MAGLKMLYQPHIHVPRRAKKGEIIRIKAKLTHPMESGWRTGRDGQPVPRNLIETFLCLFNGQEVFRADFDAGVAPDPYLSFYIRATKSGAFHFVWIEESGERYERSSKIVVT
jgi:sulfur-oxidizing protein SoxZ